MQPTDNITQEAKDISISEFCAKLKLSVHYAPKDLTHLHFTTCNISRPGLFLAGFTDYFAEDRVQVIGEQETAYLNTLTTAKRRARIMELFLYDFPCIIFSSGLEPDKEVISAAKRGERVVLGSTSRSTTVLSELSLFLTDALAPIIRCHGVLVDVYGVGMLITGKSGVGKSETVLELIQRNHRLVADDAVNIKRIGTRLVGSSPETIKHFLEVRGLGIIDISLMYGAGAFVDEKDVDLCINLEDWNPNKDYDRLGAAGETHSILDVKLPQHTIPVKTGRNLAVILEVAARNYRLKSMGFDAFEELKKRIGMM